MRRLTFCYILIITLLALVPAYGKSDGLPAKDKKWNLPKNYEKAPQWFRDAKFGIYLHWGVLSVPAYGNDWYPRNMHIKGTDENKHQLATYGPLDKFGYQDFVPLFKAQFFDANAWADLFVRSGARFAGQVAEHHDGFAMWASRINPWNVKDMGPKMDVMEQLSTAIHQRGMKFIATFHMARNLQLYASNPEAQSDSSYYPYRKDLFTSSDDPKLRLLYGNIPAKQFDKNWLGKLKEVISCYQPDLIYFDGLLTKIPQSYRTKFIRYYVRSGQKTNREVVMIHKDHDLPKAVSVEDFERGRPTRILKDPWMSDETIGIGSWSYVQGLQVKPADEIIHELIDIISKNGVMLLNISPRADGIIPENQRKVLLQIGDWLKQNGEAVFSSRPWNTFGEGPTRLKKGGAFADRIRYTAKDIRYTLKDNCIYAFVLGCPRGGEELVLSAFSDSDHLMPVKQIGLLGDEASPVKWSRKADGLHIRMPDKAPNSIAVVFKIELNGQVNSDY